MHTPGLRPRPSPQGPTRVGRWGEGDRDSRGGETPHKRERRF